MDPWIFRFNLHELAALATLFSGLMLALLLGFAKRTDERANLFLSCALVAIILKTGGITAFFLPAIGPFLYWYVQKLTFPDWRFRWKDALHLLILPAGFWMPTWLALFSIIFYLYFSQRLINHFYRQLRLVLMDRPRFAFRRLERALQLIGFFCLLSLFNNNFYFGIATVLIGMSVEILLRPANAVQLSTSIADRSDEKQRGRRLKEVVAANRLYEDADLTLATLAVKLSIPPHDLSRIINTGLEKNFNDFINEFRVRDIARKMQDPAFDRFTLLAIAYESGFNSKTTFNRVFKEMTGKTPLEYKKNLKNDVPSYHLAPRSARRPVILRTGSPVIWAAEKSKRNSMIRNYLKIAYRQLLKQKMYAVIKIGGFALGIAACVLIGLYIRNQTSYDHFYPGADRIFRLVGDGERNQGLAWPAPMSRAIQNDYPEVALAGRIRPLNSYVGHGQLRRADQAENTYEEGIIYADQSFLDALQLPTVYGNTSTALKSPQTMVISQTIANKYYPGQNPVGQVMYLDNDKSHPYSIGAVMADIPNNSHLYPFHFFLTLAGMEFGDNEQNDWRWYNYAQYIKLKPGIDATAFEKKLTAGIRKTYFLPQYLQEGMKNAGSEANKISLHLQPIKDINLYSGDFSDGITNGDIRFVWLFGAVALFILVIACINFINLSTARSANRAKEVGLRKVVGSYRSSLILQFLTESLIYSFISFVLGIIIAWLLLPWFNTIASKSLTMPWTEWWFVPVILLSAITVGGLAGLYPAFYLSGFRPVQVLKGTLSNGSKNPLLRNGLVVFQFVASIILIISTIIIYSQTRFILTQKVGFEKDQVMVLHSTNTLGDENIASFKTALTKIASVKSASISDYLPIDGTNRNQNTFFKEGRERLDPGVGGQIWQVDDTYLQTLGIKLIEGRNFSSAISSDTAGGTVVINQDMVKKLGLKSPLGARITNGGVFTVIGIVEDFNFESLRGNISPMVLHFGISPSIMTVKFSGANAQQVIAEVSALWKKFSPDQPIRYTFLDQDFAHMYDDVQRTGTIFTSFAVLAIIIACLGLFALSAFMAEQRSKEIGIRKVLGSSVQDIVRLLSKEFVKLVLLAILIASPIAWWVMNTWLQNFAYRTPIGWWMFAAAGLGVVLIALITVSFQSVKAAIANPVKSLRTDS